MVDESGDPLGVTPLGLTDLDGVILKISGPPFEVIIVDLAVKNGDHFPFADGLIGEDASAAESSYFAKGNFRIIHVI